MAVAEELIVLVRAEVDNALKNLNKVEKQTGKAHGGFKKFTSFLKTTGIGSFLAVGTAIAATTKLINDSIKAYGIQEEAEASLANALKVTEQYSSTTMNALKDYASELQNVTKYGDETTISAMAMLQQLSNLSEEGLMEITPLVQDFATAMGVDLNTAASLVGKTLSSSTNALSRYGIEIDMTGDKESKLSQLTEQLGSKFGGAAEAAADTASGSLVQYKNAVGDLQEAIGGVILEGAQPFLNVMKNIASQVAESINATREFKNVMDALKDGGMNTTDALGDVQQSIDYVKEKLEILNRVNGVKNYAKIEQYEEELELLQTQYRNLAQLQYQEALREDAAAAAAKRIKEQRDLEKAAGIRLQEILDSRLTAEEVQIQKLQEEIDKWAAFRDVAGVQELLNELIEERNGLLEKNKEVLSKVSSESEFAMAAMLSGYEDLSYAEELRGEVAQEVHEKVVENLKKEKALRESVTYDILDSAFAVASAWADTYAAMNEESEEAARIQAGIAKAQAVYEIAVATLVAATNALKLGPIAGPIAAGVITALGVANAAAVVAEPMPALAEGGIVTKPTTALIGEAGPEAVVPLNKGFGNTTIHVHGSLIMQEQLETFIAGINAKNNRGY